mmetsp:Transcript_1475/g.2456  ORF Transcript_1475/g.2456 Transcript_1475/m.2456 type:complete len:441 (+) Transcript_1475:106-1428(+)
MKVTTGAIVLCVWICCMRSTFGASHSKSTTTTRTISVENEYSTEKDAGALRGKLEVAEGRVRELVSKLESVSVDATRAKSEIHETLNEAWGLVDLLSKNRCGDAVEKVRIKQKEVESQLDAQQEIIQQRDKLLIKARKEREEVEQARLEVEKLLPIYENEKATLKREILELRDKLAIISSVQNGSNIYSSLNPHFEAMAEKIDERAKLLSQVLSIANKIAHDNTEIAGGLSSLEQLVRDVDSQFQATLLALRSDNFDPIAIKQSGGVSALERQLREAQVAKDAAMKEVKKLYEALHALQHSKGISPRDGFESSNSNLWVIIISIFIGATITALVNSLRSRNGTGGRPMAGGPDNRRPQYGAGPSPARPSGPASSGANMATPLADRQAANGAMSMLKPTSALRTPSAAASTPASVAGIAHSDRSPMQYVRSRENTPSAFRK